MRRRAVGLGLVGAALVVAIPWLALSEGIGSDAAAIQKASRQSQQSEASQAEPPGVPAKQQQADRWDHNDPCDSPQAREEADLCQQWRMAQATEELRATADAQFWATLAEAGLLALTLIATAIAAVAAVWAARAAQGAVNVATEMGQRQIRAYIALDSAKIVGFSIGEEPVVTVRMKNCGMTPANDVKAIAHINMNAREKALYIRFDRASTAKSVTSMGRDATIIVEQPFNRAMREEVISEIRKGSGWLVVAGIYVVYRDVFNKRRRTIAKLVLDPTTLHEGNGRFRPHHKGNRGT